MRKNSGLSQAFYVCVYHGKKPAILVKPGFQGHFFFDKVGLSQKNILVQTHFCGEVSLSNICDKGERAK